MWFVLGIVSFSGFFAYHLWRKIFWAWDWTDDTGTLRHGDRPYKTRHSEHQGTHSFGYAVASPSGFYFRIQRETRWDRWAKKIGLSVEHQLADPEFDSDLYLASDDPPWLAELSRTPELRNVLKAMFRDKNVRSITCEGRHLWVEVQLRSSETPLEYLNGAAARNIVAALDSIAGCLESVAEVSGTRSRDPYVLRAVMLVSLSSALLMLAGVELLRIFRIERADVMIDGWGLFGFSFVVIALVLAGLLLASAAWLKGSSHAHLVMLEILISGGLGLLGSGYALGRDINCEWDRATATPHHLTVAKKYTGYRRKYGTYYKLEFDAARTIDFPRTIEVNRITYSMATAGKPMVLWIKPGFLGYRWIESVRRPE